VKAKWDNTTTNTKTQKNKLMTRNTYAFSNGIYNDWHRQYEGIAMIDIDSVEVCKYCYEPLAIIETAYYKGHTNKATRLTKEIAKRCNVPAYMLFYYEYKTPAKPPIERAKHPQILTNEDRVSVDLRFVWRNLSDYPPTFEETDQDGWLNELNMLHKRHSEVCRKWQK
jgi:hypothetical protein